MFLTPSLNHPSSNSHLGILDFNPILMNQELAKNVKLASGPQIITKLRNFAFQTLQVKEKKVSLHLYQCLSSQEKYQYL